MESSVWLELAKPRFGIAHNVSESTELRAKCGKCIAFPYQYVEFQQ
ncbi:Uncharacterised protein [Vibrio cholerae]|uniref:Uncharacterized protein n=1 Tax=Vibrio cholerae TaxID=666 RepID=A0A655UUB5_VIBCL|nr:Uncharacterised protein [Vibrio cholerae]CSB56686.1 Uncharacterised protein [Vibrio cholerae]CSB69512.1 Uncharacterised protein [Vibrio cholerae]CSC06975.1 Uncharacterised protein [Vibrio cholerae]